MTDTSRYVDAEVVKLPDHCGYGDTTQAPETQSGPAQDLVQVRTGHGMATGTQPARPGHVRCSDQGTAEGDLTPRLAAILLLKCRYWTPGKIRRLLDAAESAGRSPLAMAHEAATREAIANLRPAAARYVAELESERRKAASC